MTTAILIAALLIFINKILFAIEKMLCQAIDVLYDMFLVFAGIKPIKVDGTPAYIVDMFLNDDSISTIYAGMALIGIVLTFAFAIGAVVKKMFDSTGEKVKATYGMILTNGFKSCLLIGLMTAIVSATVSATGILMRQINTLFDMWSSIKNPDTIVFTDSQRAGMYRVLSVVGNYTLNPSYDNRFNINSCYNEIQPDLRLLAQEGIFNYTYEDEPTSWQYAIRKLYIAADTKEQLSIDVYNERVTAAMLFVANQIKENAIFVPLSSYTRDNPNAGDYASLGRIVMLSGSMRAAKNSTYNNNAQYTDALRAPYYFGDKDVFDYDTVDNDFKISLFDWEHLVIITIGYFLLKELAKLLINCVARIFNILLLYLTAPGFLAVMPLDDGGKFKQWTTAFVIQSLSIFGSLMAVRLMMVAIPIIMRGGVVLFENSVQNVIAKLIFVVGICVTTEKASGMISGILADNAGYQSIMAGDVGGGVVSKGLDIGGKALSAAGSLGFQVADKALGGIGAVTGLSTLKDKVTKGFGNKMQAMRDKGGVVGAAKNGFTTKEQDEKAEAEKKETAQNKNTDAFRNLMAEGMEKLINKGGSVPPPGGGAPKPDGNKPQGSETNNNPNNQNNQNSNPNLGNNQNPQGQDPSLGGSNQNQQEQNPNLGNNNEQNQPKVDPNAKPDAMGPPDIGGQHGNQQQQPQPQNLNKGNGDQ